MANGQRLGAVGWVQSLIRNVDQREILFDLDAEIGANSSFFGIHNPYISTPFLGQYQAIIA